MSDAPRARRGSKGRRQKGASPVPPPSFDAGHFLETAGVARRVVTYRRGEVVFSQGDPCDAVMYILKGGVKLSVVSRAGKQAVVAILGPGEFLGEGALAGQPVRMATARTIAPATLLVVQKRQMIRMLHAERALADRFISHLLARNIRVEEDLVDQLFNSSEKRLARVLLILARYGRHAGEQRVLPRLSQETLAEMVGTTRSRVNYFMNKFRRLGLIEYNGSLKVHDALVSIVLYDR
jgi:CRP/FNR family transcriptional regulator, cyclic AMP receptor protein